MNFVEAVVVQGGMDYAISRAAITNKILNLNPIKKKSFYYPEQTSEIRSAYKCSA